MTYPWRLLLIGLLPALVLASIGCGRSDLPELGRVQGTVTLDGKPLAGVIVTFQPDSGRPAVANADSEGRYDLMYTNDVKGATVGQNTVKVIWPDGATPTAKIPEEYGYNSTIKKEVKAGKQTIDIAMKSM